MMNQADDPMIQTGRTLHNSTDIPGPMSGAWAGEWRRKREAVKQSAVKENPARSELIAGERRLCERKIAGYAGFA